MIFSVGPASTIPHSVEIVVVKDKDNLDKFKKQLNGIQKNKVLLCTADAALLNIVQMFARQ